MPGKTTQTGSGFSLGDGGGAVKGQGRGSCLQVTSRWEGSQVQAQAADFSATMTVMADIEPHVVV